MHRLVIGVLVPVIGTLWGYTHSGGRVGALFHISEIVINLSFIVGGMAMAYGWSDSVEMFRAALDRGGKCSRERLNKCALICEGASKFSLYGGFVASFLGVAITMSVISSDVATVGDHFAAALTGLLQGAAIAGVLFQPLKFRFLSQLQELDKPEAGKQGGDA